MSDTPIYDAVVRWQARQDGAAYVRKHLPINACRTCNAYGGEPCHTATGKRLRRPHKGRRWQ